MLRILSALYHFARGQHCLKREDHSGALFHFSNVIRANPRNHYAYHNRGVAQQAMGAYASSVQDFDQAIKLNPRLMASYGARGISRKFLGDWDGAIEDQNSALALDPKQGAAHAELGVAYHAKGNADRAIIHLTAAINLDPRSQLNYRERGYVQFCRGKFEAAASDLRRSLELGQDPYAMLIYYLVQVRLTDNAGAELAALAARLTDHEWPAPVFEFYLGRLSESAVLDAASTAHLQGEAYFYIAEWHLMRGEPETAMKALRRSLQLLPPWFSERHAAEAELKRIE